MRPKQWRTNSCSHGHFQSANGMHRRTGRRNLLATSAASLLVIGQHLFIPARAEQLENDTILQPETSDEVQFMQRAFDMRQLAIDQGDQAYGGVIVRDKIIIGQSWSRVILDQDPTAHAEVSAIRDAARRQNNRNLSGAIMYSSSKPCPMCVAAAYWAGIDELVYGRAMIRAGSPVLCG